MTESLCGLNSRFLVNMCDLPNYTPADFDLEAIPMLLINLRRINKLYKLNF